MYADLGTEQPMAVERYGQKLVVEVKSFIGASKIQGWAKAATCLNRKYLLRFAHEKSYVRKNSMTKKFPASAFLNLSAVSLCAVTAVLANPKSASALNYVTNGTF